VCRRTTIQLLQGRNRKYGFILGILLFKKYISILPTLSRTIFRPTDIKCNGCTHEI